MSVRPWFHPLDRADVRELADLHTARALDLPREQHALMSGYGGPGQGRSCYITATTTISYRVPPGVTEVDVEAWIAADGTNDDSNVVFTSSVDATGTKFNLVGGNETDVSSATRYQTGGPLASSYGAQSGRALTVRSAVAWTWADVDVTVTITAVGTDVVIYALAFKPVHAFR